MTLYIDYRPDELEYLWGNEKTVGAINAMLERERENIPHSFLFTGPSGTGKTTVARILAAGLGCGMEHDYYEIDSAHFGGVEDIRKLRNKMLLKPKAGSCRVYLFDECHKMTDAAQNALLKALEDTPRHVYLIMATTDPRKLLKTIKTRCITFEMQPLSVEDMTGLIESVLAAEEKTIPAKVIAEIVQESLGSARQALTILDAIIDMPEGEMLETVRLRAAEESQSIELCRALMRRAKWKEVAEILEKLEGDPEGVRRHVLGYTSATLLRSGKGQAAVILDAFREPLYDIGKPGLVLACWEALEG